MEHLDDFVFSVGLVLNVHDRVVNIRIKLLAERRDLGYAELFERLVKLHHRHFHALAVRFVCRRRGERSFQIVVDRKELEQRVRLYIGIQTLALFLAALAEVIVLGAEPEVLFLFRLNELFGRFLYLGLFFGLFLLLFVFFIFLGLRFRFVLYFFGSCFDLFFFNFLGLRLLLVYVFLTAHL